MPSRTFHITNVMAASLDGYVALHDKQSDAERHAQGFSNHEDWDHLLGLIATADAIILGSQTLQAGGGVIDQPRSDGHYPVWITLTNRGIPADHVFWSQDFAPRVLISEEPLKMPPHAAQVVNASGQDTLSEVIRYLNAHDLRRVLLFGGGYINKLFYDARLVDELILTVCPILVARSGAVPLIKPTPDGPLTHFRLISAQPHGNLVILHYEVQPPSSSSQP